MKCLIGLCNINHLYMKALEHWKHAFTRRYIQSCFPTDISRAWLQWRVATLLVLSQCILNLTWIEILYFSQIVVIFTSLLSVCMYIKPQFTILLITLQPTLPKSNLMHVFVHNHSFWLTTITWWLPLLPKLIHCVWDLPFLVLAPRQDKS